MKLYVKLVHVAAVLALTGSTLGDGDTEADSPIVCPLKEDEGKGMNEVVFDLTRNCYDTDETLIYHLANPAATLEDRKAFFKNLCDRRSQIRECLAGVEQQSKVCLNQTSHNISQMVRDLLATILDSGCVQDGEVIASIGTLHTDSPRDPLKSDPFHDCKSHTIGIFGVSFESNLEILSRFFLLYREFVNMKECFANIAEGDLNISANISSVLSDITKKMKCIHPQDETPVLCTTIDITLPDTPRICPIKPLNGNKSVLHDTLTERLMWCFGHYNAGETMADNGIATTIDSSRAFMKNYCGKKRIAERCWIDTLALSSVCLDETQNNFVTAVGDSLRHVYDYSCIDDGHYLAYVLHEVSGDVKNTSTEESNGIRECLDVAERAFEGVPKGLNAATMLIYYQQLIIFKECLINKLRGNNDVVFIADTVITLVARSMKCIDPLDGTIVLCETIDTTASKGSKVCPFVGEKENEGPNSGMFVNQGFMCLKASTVNFRHMNAFTTLSEYEKLFNLFCQNRRSVKHCIDALSSNSAVCQNQTSHQMLGIFTDVLESGLEIGCQQDGGPLAIMTQGRMEDAAQGGSGVCFHAAGGRLKDVGSANDNLSAKSVLAFRAFESMKECVLNGNYEVGFKNVFSTFVNDILRRFKCVHPDDGTTVLCETIANN